MQRVSMTSVLDEPAAVGDAAALLDQHPRRRRNRVVAFGLALVVLGVGVALWALLPGFIAIGRTGVVLDAKPFVCRSATDVMTYNAGDGFDTSQALFVPAIRLRPGLDCTMTVVIRNDGDADVAVDSITLPLAGPANGTGVHADRAQTQGIGPAGGRDDTDATFDYAHDPDSGGAFPVAAHSLQRFDVHLTWSDGCEGDGSATIFSDAPTVVLSSGPWHLTKSANGAGYAFVGSRSSISASCDR